MDLDQTITAQSGEEMTSSYLHRRHWWDYMILVCALGVFVLSAAYAKRPPLAINYGYAMMLVGVMLLFLVAGGWALWKCTRFA